MKWDKNTKEEITYISAVIVLLFGIGLSIAGFVVSPVGIIDNSILWVLGQCFIYTGSVFGITLYVNSQITKIKEECLNKLKNK